MKEKQNCKYCGCKATVNGDICGNCQKKLKLIRSVLKEARELKALMEGGGK